MDVVGWGISLVVAGSPGVVQGRMQVVFHGDDLWLAVGRGVVLAANPHEVGREAERELHRAVVVQKQEPGVENVM